MHDSGPLETVLGGQKVALEMGELEYTVDQHIVYGAARCFDCGGVARATGGTLDEVEVKLGGYGWSCSDAKWRCSGCTKRSAPPVDLETCTPELQPGKCSVRLNSMGANQAIARCAGCSKVSGVTESAVDPEDALRARGWSCLNGPWICGTCRAFDWHPAGRLHRYAPAAGRAYWVVRCRGCRAESRRIYCDLVSEATETIRSIGWSTREDGYLECVSCERARIHADIHTRKPRRERRPYSLISRLDSALGRVQLGVATPEEIKSVRRAAGRWFARQNRKDDRDE